MKTQILHGLKKTGYPTEDMRGALYDKTTGIELRIYRQFGRKGGPKGYSELTSPTILGAIDCSSRLEVLSNTAANIRSEIEKLGKFADELEAEIQRTK